MSSKNSSTRVRILKSTLKLLEDGNGSAVRMSDIARASKISRQALYLHFPTRAELLVETTRYLDELHKIDDRLAASRLSASGRDRLLEWIDVWGNYIPEIYGVAKALMAMKDNDTEAMAAWTDRMQAVRHGCAAAISDLIRDGDLNADLSASEATDILWTLLSVRVWEQLRADCGWTQERYILLIKRSAMKTLVE